MANPYANKAFLNAQLVTLNQTSFTQTAASGTVTQSGTTLTFTSISPATALPLGSYITITGYSAVAVVGVTSPTVYTVDLAQTIAVPVAAAVFAYTVVVENALNTLLTTSQSAANYYKFVAATVAGLNAINAANPTTSTTGKNGLRYLQATDDGNVIFDSGKCTFASGTVSGGNNQITSLINLDTAGSYTGLGNTYINYSKKISILDNLFSSNNNYPDSTIGATPTYILGTAGGNSINENHNTRPEILAALFSNTGVAYSQRFSSTTASLNFYLANRVGMSAEIPLGVQRVNVPMIYG